MLVAVAAGAGALWYARTGRVDVDYTLTVGTVSQGGSRRVRLDEPFLIESTGSTPCAAEFRVTKARSTSPPGAELYFVKYTIRRNGEPIEESFWFVGLGEDATASVDPSEGDPISLRVRVSDPWLPR